jgi:hypothetical protein
MAGQGDQFEFVIPDDFRSRVNRLASRRRLGSLDPVAREAINVVGKRHALLPLSSYSRGQGGCGCVGEHLIAEKMIRVVVAQIYSVESITGRDTREPVAIRTRFECGASGVLSGIHPNRADISLVGEVFDPQEFP